jgi:hypothetical protein
VIQSHPVSLTSGSNAQPCKEDIVYVLLPDTIPAIIGYAKATASVCKFKAPVYLGYVK